jgi:hypothetical protein
MISLFRAYGTATNEEFLQSITYWKNDWTSGNIKEVEKLMEKADAKYSELRDLGTWGKRAGHDDQIVALTSQIEELKRSVPSANQKKGQQESKASNSRSPKWKYDRSLSAKETLTRGDKTYQWCTGPGHHNRGMWVVHKPGTCTQAQSGAQANDRNSNMNTFAAVLKGRGMSDDEIESKMSAILAVMDS